MVLYESRKIMGFCSKTMQQPYLLQETTSADNWPCYLQICWGTPSHPFGESLLVMYKNQSVLYITQNTSDHVEARNFTLAHAVWLCHLHGAGIWYLFATIPAISYELREFFLGKMRLSENQIFFFFNYTTEAILRILSIPNNLR